MANILRKEVWFCNECKNVSYAFIDENIKETDLLLFFKNIKALFASDHKKTSPNCSGSYCWVNTFVFEKSEDLRNSQEIPEWAKEKIISILFGEVDKE